jgi:signal transduction histidine kinase
MSFIHYRSNEKILDTFFNVRLSASKSDSGTGLGLYISKSIIEAHGGKIWAENNSDGRGATFSFTLPLNKAE